MARPHQATASVPTASAGTGAVPRPRGRYWRGDVLRLLVGFGEGAEEEVAVISGFGWEAARPLPQQEASRHESSPEPQVATPLTQTLQATLYSATVTRTDVSDVTEDAFDVQQQLLQAAEAPAPENMQPPPPLPPWTALSSQRRLINLAEKHLRGLHPINQWDGNKLAAQLAQGLPPNPRHARAERLRWQGHALVIFMQAETEPLHDDYRRLAAMVAQRSGGRIPVYVHYQQLGWYRYESQGLMPGGDPLACLWRSLPQAPRLDGMRGLVVGWPGAGSHLRTTGWAPSAMLAAWVPALHLPASMPTQPPQHWPGLPLLMWDHGSRLQRQRRLCPLLASSLQVQQLLALMSLAVVVDAPLLRALRLLLGLPVCTEVQVWSSSEVANAGFAIAIKGTRRAQAILRLQTDIPLPIRQQAAAIIAAHHHPDHANLSFEITLEEAQLAQLYAPGADVIDPTPWFQVMAHELYRSQSASGQGGQRANQQANPQAELCAYLARQGHRTAGAAWQKNAAFTTAWALANPQAILQGKDLPAEFDLQVLPRLRQLLNREAADEPATQGLRLCLEDEALIAEVCPLEVLQSCPQQGRDVLAQWASPLLLKWKTQGHSTWQGPLHASELGRIDLSQHAPLELDDGQTRCLIEPVLRPRWALELGRSREGLFVLVPNPWGAPERMPWPLAGQVGVSKSYTLPVPAIESNVVRANIVELTLAVDVKGPLARLTMKGLYGSHTQAFRYIAPGEFVMGSPLSETVHNYYEWFANERPQHTVRISHGFWLANTACSRGFWNTLMGEGENDLPSQRFGGAEYPVESVSWDMIQPFLQKISNLLPGLVATLPTEAEWEYACRAGTNTAFSFGEDVSPAQVNYDGNYPFKGTIKGESRGGTVPVKQFHDNDWGLYQMHGNVWEWCADPFREYIADSVVDPGLAEALTPSGGINARVLRGGGWPDRALYARSAFRYLSAPIGLNDSTGFRIALRDFRQASGI